MSALSHRLQALLGQPGSGPLIKVSVFAVAVLAIVGLYLTVGADPTGDALRTDSTNPDQAGSDDPNPGNPDPGNPNDPAAPATGDPTATTEPLSGASSRTIDPGPAAGCTLFVSPDGNDSADGRTPSTPVRSPAQAVDRAAPGDEVCLAPGTYTSTDPNRGALHIEDLHGLDGSPITFRSLDPDQPARLTMGHVGAGPRVSVVFLQRSSHLIIDGFEVTEGFRGVTGNGVNHIELRNSSVHHIGGELVFFGKRAGRIQPDLGANPPSHHIIIDNNELAHSGQADSSGRRFGEAIYLGTSEITAGDDTNNVTITNNLIHHIVDEAIDAKTGVHTITIADNDIHHIDLDSQAAITLAIHGQSWHPGRFAVTGNRIADITRRGTEAAAIWVGHGDTVVTGNIIWNVADWGIYIPNTFNLPEARAVELRANTIWNTGDTSILAGRDWGAATSGAAELTVTPDNTTWDGAAGTTMIDTCPACTLETPR